jgi:hypothetical protein
MPTKTVAAKLLIKPGSSLWLSDAAHASRLEPLPEGVRQVDGPGTATTALLFVESAAAARALLDAHREQLAQPSVLWVAYPKAGRADINRDTLWPILADYGLRPIGQVAVDDVWSALRFRPLKEGEERFTGGQ